MSGRLVDTFKRTLSSQKSSARALRNSQRASSVQKSQNGGSLSGLSSKPQTGLATPVMNSKMSENVRKAYSASRENIKSKVAELGRKGYASKISDFFTCDFAS